MIMAIIDDSGGAFPIHGNDGPIDYGMSLRDYFAGQALVGIATSIPEERSKLIRDGVQGGMIEASIAYVLADAMLKVRRLG
jgi:hypothetical protein